MEWTRKDIEKNGIIIGEIAYKEVYNNLLIDRLYISTDSTQNNADWFLFLDKLVPHYSFVSIASKVINVDRANELKKRGFIYDEEELQWVHKNL